MQTSEFGGSTMSSFESTSVLLKEEEWSIHGGVTKDNCTQTYLNENTCFGNNAMSERNYPCDNHIEAFFGTYDLDEIGEFFFKKQLYHCMMAHTLWMKSEIERQRSTNSFGSLVRDHLDIFRIMCATELSSCLFNTKSSLLHY